MNTINRRIFISRGDEMEDGPFALNEAPKLLRSGSYQLSDDARFEDERVWSKLGELVRQYCPRESVLIASIPQDHTVHPAVESLLNLPFTRLLPFVFKLYLAILVVGIGFGAIVMIFMGLFGLIFGAAVFSGLHR